jgi:hypothetical protein
MRAIAAVAAALAACSAATAHHSKHYQGFCHNLSFAKGTVIGSFSDQQQQHQQLCGILGSRVTESIKTAAWNMSSTLKKRRAKLSKHKLQKCRQLLHR